MASIQRVLEEAQLMADCQIKAVYTGIAGSHIRCCVARDSRDQKEVTQATSTAWWRRQPSRSPTTRRSHRAPRLLIRADCWCARHAGRVRLEVDVPCHEDSAVENVTKCIRRCGPSSRCRAAAARMRARRALEDEKDLTFADRHRRRSSDIAVYAGGAIRYAVIPIAGDQVTNDVAMTLRTPTKEAEVKEVRYGCAASARRRERHHRSSGVGERSRASCPSCWPR